MEAIKATSALYIKMGGQRISAKQCIDEGILKIGWEYISHEDCLNNEWDKVRDQQRKQYEDSQIRENAISNQVNQIRKFYETDESVLWITFHNNLLYWCFAEKEVILQKDKFRIRKTVNGWKCTDIKNNLLDENRLSGELVSVQGYRSTICNVKVFKYLLSKINCEESVVVEQARNTKAQLVKLLEEIICNFHSKEFELLVDLIFREAGWQRLSSIGKTMQNIDLELYSPVIRETIKVQVKAKAKKHELIEFQKLKSAAENDASYYFVTQRDKTLEEEMDNPDITFWTPKELASLSMSYGLVDWILERAW